MAITASGLYYQTFQKALTNTIALDLSSTTAIKFALFTDTISPNFDTDTVYGSAPYNANEVTSSTEWPSGGVVLTPVAADTPDGFSVSSGTLLWDADNVSVASTTLTDAMGGLIYWDGATKDAVCLVDFTTPYSTSNGTFAVTWSTSPDCVFSIDLTP